MKKTRLSQDEWRRVEEVYHEALEHRPESRPAFVVAACAGDSSLRREVESLLAADGAGTPCHRTTERSNSHSRLSAPVYQFAGSFLDYAQSGSWPGGGWVGRSTSSLSHRLLYERRSLLKLGGAAVSLLPADRAATV